MNSYEAKQQAKKERYEELAQKAERESNAAGNAALDMARQIPLGQPILVGHHSESKHRNHIKRTDAKMHKAAQLAEKAEHYASKAAGVGTGGISSDDPDAIDKLKEKIEIMREFQAGYKEINRLIRKGVPDEEFSRGNSGS